MPVPRSPTLRHGYLLVVEQILHRVALRPSLQGLIVTQSVGLQNILCLTFEDNLSAQSSGIRTDIDQIVGSAHDLLVVLDDDDGVAQRLQFLQHMDQTVGVASMQADARLVEDIERSHQ